MWPAAAAAAAAAASPRPGIDIVMVARVAGLQSSSSTTHPLSQIRAQPLIGRCLVSAADLHLHLHSLLTGLQHTAQAPDNAMSNGKIAEY